MYNITAILYVLSQFGISVSICREVRFGQGQGHRVRFRWPTGTGTGEFCLITDTERTTKWADSKRPPSIYCMFNLYYVVYIHAELEYRSGDRPELCRSSLDVHDDEDRTDLHLIEVGTNFAVYAYGDVSVIERKRNKTQEQKFMSQNKSPVQSIRQYCA